MTCKIRIEKGVCGKPAEDAIEIQLAPHDFVQYVKEVELQRVPVCGEHMKLFAEGWSLRGGLVFRWVPPK